MGAGVKPAYKGGRRRGRRKVHHAPMSEINVTPFVDVMLVLLIIFMVAAPLLTVGVPIDLPETRAKPMEGDTEPITISIRNSGQVFIQDTEIDPDEIVAKLQAIAKTGYEERIYVRGDRDADYGVIMQIMGRISAAGYKRIGLVTLEEQGG
ncbi:biopolymer transport protein TolR [Rhodobium orientis]|uniref:Protein TolR n=1 Tax=Rhodobium orientis TaxID=34017 RepID=A0A327JWN3_9HYPH|nr:protein TolR [Rhodobium orientis]MBB4303015.1 biopolymer transport protein TolR [Rhodobium orientis]MBK5949575.1 protein TolR [Rhodobium orientis]RAI29362.1 protein TolR [Rhodobium orientis]